MNPNAPMLANTLTKLKNKNWLPLLICLLPIIIYIWVFQAISLNINYLAFDDILILGIIPGFTDASWPEKWQRLTTLFPEHRLVFSRSVILLFFEIFGRINLVWLMIVGNMCWAGCAFFFYKVFKKTNLSVLYFIPVMWIWFNIQSFENIFWGVSSLCNFGVLLFVIACFYNAVYHTKQIYIALLWAICATFTYGNGLMSFPIIALICLLTGRKRQFVTVVGVTALIVFIYFIDFVPITQNLNFKNPNEVKDGILGIFGFIGSIATMSAYGVAPSVLLVAVGAGMLMIALFLILFKKEWRTLWNAILQSNPYQNKEALFSLSLVLFIGITAIALVYKRIPTDSFEGIFKGRYRMYSTLACVAVYFMFLTFCSNSKRQHYFPALLLISIGLNLIILHDNFASALNNRRAFVAQEFNARYNDDWLGLKMFDMDRSWFEKIRSFYRSSDPLAEGWEPHDFLTQISCDSTYTPSSVLRRGDYIDVNFSNISFKTAKDYTDGAYVILRSTNHVYVLSLFQTAVPLKTVIRRQMYFARAVSTSFHTANIEPGVYNIYLLVRENGLNKIYCTNKTWNEQ